MPGTGRSLALDGLRGYAAVAVVFYHTILGPNPQLVPDVMHRGVGAQDTATGVLTKLVLALTNGEVAVSVFFVISGIVLVRALRAMHDGGRSALGTSWRFLLRRVLRLWPVMAVCLVAKVVLFRQIALAWPGSVAAPTAEDLVANLLLTGFPVHGATWTLLVELVAAPVLLLCFFAVRGLGAWAALAFLAYASLAHIQYHKLLFHSPELIAGLPYLLAGAALECGWLAALMRSRLRGPVAVAALVLLAATLLLVPREALRLHAGGLLVAIPLLVGWVDAAAGDGPVGRALTAPLSLLLGRISFSLYLWNVPVFELMYLLVPTELLRDHPLETGLLVGLAAVVVTIPIAHLSERWLERPCIHLGRALTGYRPLPRGKDVGGPSPSAARADGAGASWARSVHGGRAQGSLAPD